MNYLSGNGQHPTKKRVEVPVVWNRDDNKDCPCLEGVDGSRITNVGKGPQKLSCRNRNVFEFNKLSTVMYIACLRAQSPLELLSFCPLRRLLLIAFSSERPFSFSLQLTSCVRSTLPSLVHPRSGRHHHSFRTTRITRTFSSLYPNFALLTSASTNRNGTPQESPQDILPSRSWYVHFNSHLIFEII